MPDELNVPAEQPKPYDPFDLGDTSLHLNLPPRDDRPRNPDGTFTRKSEPGTVAAPASGQPQANTTAPAQTIPPPPKDPWRPTLERQARELGFTDEDITGLPNEALFRSINLVVRQNMEHAREMTRAKTIMDAEVRTPEPVDDSYHPDWGTNPETGEAIRDEDVHPSVVRTIRDLGTRNKQLEKRLEEREKAESQRSFNETTDALDDIFEMIGPDFEEVFGKGSGADLLSEDKNHPGFKRRLAILREANMNVNQMTPGAIRRAAGKIKQIAEVLYGESSLVQKRRKPAQQPTNPQKPAGIYSQTAVDPQTQRPPVVTEEEWDEAGVAVPTSRPPVDLPKGDERAVRNLAARMDRQRVNGRQSDADIRKGLFPGGQVSG